MHLCRLCASKFAPEGQFSGLKIRITIFSIKKLIPATRGPSQNIRGSRYASIAYMRRYEACSVLMPDTPD